MVDITWGRIFIVGKAVHSAIERHTASIVFSAMENKLSKSRNFVCDKRQLRQQLSTVSGSGYDGF
jgi:hypothetical protein